MAESIKVCSSLYDDWLFFPEEGNVKLKDKGFSYDYILTPEAEQEEMYEKVGKQTITDFMNGFNGTIFAYGQSGSGKTFSMLGPEDVTEALSKDFKSVPEKVQSFYGITPRAVIQMFETINEYVSQGSQCILHVSYIEIYNEQINCLLSKRENLKVREIPGVGFSVADKDSIVCKTPEEIFECISIATKNRAVTSTQQNSRSSRSHTILMIDFDYNGIDGVKKSSRLNLVDLAGSERIAKTQVTGQGLKEAQKINQSLTTLGMCIMALTTPGSKHIPFRNSKLTLILKESLGGNSKTTLICTASKRKEHSEESVQTCNFASRAKAIKNTCKKNVQMGVKELQYLVDVFKREILLMRSQLKKGGLNFTPISDPKILAVLPNESTLDETDHPNELITSSSPLRRRVSLNNLSEEQIVLKYCELKAKYDNLLEEAGKRINELASNHIHNNVDADGLVDDLKLQTNEKIQEIEAKKNDEISRLLEEINLIKQENDDIKSEMDKRVLKSNKEGEIIEEENKNLKSELTTLQEMLNLNSNDIDVLTASKNKLQEETENLHNQINNLKNEAEQADLNIAELSEKIKQLEEILIGNKQKIEESDNSIVDLNLQVGNYKNQLKLAEQIELNQINKNKELQAEIALYSEIIANNEKLITDSNNKLLETELQFKNDFETLNQKENYLNSQVENLKTENANLNKLIQEKVSDQELLSQQKNILKSTKENLEARISELTLEIEKLRNEILETSKKYINQNSDLALQIENLNREMKVINSEKEDKIEEINNLRVQYEEKLKLENARYDQLQTRAEANSEKVKDLEIQNLTLNEKQKKLELDLAALNKDLKDKTEDILNLNENIKEQTETQSKLLKQINDSKETINELKVKLFEENENEKKKILQEKLDLENEVALKDKLLLDQEIKYKELKKQFETLQQAFSKSQTEVSKLEANNNLMQRQSIELKKNARASIINTKVNLQDNFRGLLKKTGDNKFLKQAKEEGKEVEKKIEILFKDKINDFKQLQQNIINLAPKTISSRSSISQYSDLDFNDENAFLKKQEKLLEKENKRQELKAQDLLNIVNNNNNANNETYNNNIIGKIEG